MSQSTPEKYSADEWDHIRERYFDSILKDTEISALGQNLGISWPFKGKGETVAKYIQFDFEELKSVPGLVGKQGRVKTLMRILQGTLDFDDPFSDMADSVEAGSRVDDTFERILAKFEIPHDYPAEFIHFEETTAKLLKNEDVKTLVDVIHFGQEMVSSSVVEGGLKDFLNGLAHKDEAGIARHLPYRRGVRGLHLPEAIGLIAGDLPAVAQLQLLAQSEVALSDEAHAALAQGSSIEAEASVKVAVERVAKVCEWFTAGAAELETAFTSGGSAERYFIMINDPRKERIAVQLSKLHFGVEDVKKPGFLGRLFGR